MMNLKYLFGIILLNLYCTASTCQSIINQIPSPEDSLITFEKVYLHTDRESYYPGEDIWFKAYFIEGPDRLFSKHCTNLHVELISPDLKIIDNRITKLIEGLGNGDFTLPKDLPSGQYQLRAYTNYMRNFSDQLFFHKNITIISPAGTGKVIPDSIEYVKNKLEIDFFPEGGSLVADVQSNVAFKAVDAVGIGCNVSGDLYSSAGVKVTSFNSLHRGMGKFSIKPVSGLNYYAIVRNENGDEVKAAVPVGLAKGVVLNIAENRHNELEVTVRTNAETFPSIINQDLMLTLSVHKMVFKSVSFRMTSLNSFLIVQTGDLPDGIIMLTLSGPDNLPLCERLVYLSHGKEIKIKLETNKVLYKQRDSVSVGISFADSSTISRTAFLSLTAGEKLFTNSSSGFPSTISSWFLLESDVRGPVEDPSYYFDTSVPDRLRKLDLLLLTQGWRDFEWKYRKFNYLPEYGFDVSGRVRKKFADVPLMNARVNIAIFGKGKPFIKVVPTDSSGRFLFKGVDLTGNAKLIVSPASGTKDKLQGWLILDSLRYLPADVSGISSYKRQIIDSSIREDTSLIINDDQSSRGKYRSFIQYSEIKRSIQRQYRLSDTIKPGEVNIIARREDTPESSLSRAERNLGTIFIDKTEIINPELEKFGSIEQLMNVRLHFFSVGGKIMSHQGSPLFLLDGMRVGYDEVATLPVSIIERIDIVLNSYGNYGEAGRYGAISFTTKSNWGSIHPSKYHSANIKFSGYSEPRIFYSPKHHVSLESDYKPDLRTTLFWEPGIKLKTNENIYLNFYNSDNSSLIRVSVQGMTSDGIPLTGKVEYEVRSE